MWLFDTSGYWSVFISYFYHQDFVHRWDLFKGGCRHATFQKVSFHFQTMDGAGNFFQSISWSTSAPHRKSLKDPYIQFSLVSRWSPSTCELCIVTMNITTHPSLHLQCGIFRPFVLSSQETNSNHPTPIFYLIESERAKPTGFNQDLVPNFKAQQSHPGWWWDPWDTAVVKDVKRCQTNHIITSSSGQFLYWTYLSTCPLWSLYI